MILNYLHRIAPTTLAVFAILATVVFAVSLVCNATAYPETSLFM